MAREIQIFDRNYIAAADLSGLQYTCMALTTDNPSKVNKASSGAAIVGVLQNKPTSGQVADVRVLGLTKLLVDSGAGVTAGDKLMAVNGTGGVATATTGNFVIGFAEETAAASTYVTAVLLPGGKI